jgi:hypothetical protein
MPSNAERQFFQANGSIADMMETSGQKAGLFNP